MADSDKDTKTLGILEILAGLTTRPVDTVDKLFVKPNPIHTVMIFFILLATLLTPTLASIKTHGRFLYDPMTVVSLVMVLLFTFFYFVIIEKIFLKLLNVTIDMLSLAYAACYCTVPLIIVIWCLYAYNIFDTGGLTFVTFLVAGVTRQTDTFLNSVPLFINLALFGCFIIFYRAIKVLGNMFNTNAFIIGILSLLPFHLALILAVLTGNQIQPGTTDVFIRLLYSPESIIQ